MKSKAISHGIAEVVEMEQEQAAASETQVGGDHYRLMPIQPVEFNQRNGLSFCEASVIKYVSRHKHKNGAEDVRKAIHFLNLLLEIEYNQKP